VSDEEMVEIPKRSYEALMRIAKAVHFEKVFFPYICGMGVEVDETGLPDSVTVCAGYGSDVAYVYKKVNDVTPEW